jgi:hypothetical protein
VNRIIALSLGVALMVFSGGCLRSRVDENWGKSHEAQIALQTADPDAPATTEPQQSLDPETAKRVAERYYEGQEEQSQRQAPTITIQQ